MCTMPCPSMLWTMLKFHFSSKRWQTYLAWSSHKVTAIGTLSCHPDHLMERLICIALEQLQSTFTWQMQSELEHVLEYFVCSQSRPGFFWNSGWRRDLNWLWVWTEFVREGVLRVVSNIRACVWESTVLFVCLSVVFELQRTLQDSNY